MADARPGWDFVMVGPVVKIDPASVPRRDNIHWLGQQAYDDQQAAQQHTQQWQGQTWETQVQPQVPPASAAEPR